MTLNDVKKRFEESENRLKGIIIENMTLLDIGCGVGNTVLVAAKRGAKKAVGVDTNLSGFGDAHFHVIASENKINTQNTELIEGSLGMGKCRFDDSSFDVVTLLDVIEHIAEPASILMEINRVLKPGGIFFVESCPMYYSPVGSHLWGPFPKETMPWAHLYKNFYHELLPKSDVSGQILSWFLQLNKITYSEFLSLVCLCGFEIVKKTVFKTDITPETYETYYREKIDMSLVPSYDDLFIECISVTLTKPISYDALSSLSEGFVLSGFGNKNLENMVKEAVEMAKYSAHELSDIRIPVKYSTFENAVTTDLLSQKMFDLQRKAVLMPDMAMATGSFFKKLIKKILVKALRWYVSPVASSQSDVNRDTMQIIDELIQRMTTYEKALGQMKKSREAENVQSSSANC